MADPNATVHASAVLIGAKAALIRGAAGSGKSRLVLELLQAAGRGELPFARLVADDRVHLAASAGRLLVRPAQELAGLIELRGLGIRRMPFEAIAVVALVVDLGTAGERLPAPADLETRILGVALPRLGLPAGAGALPVVIAALGHPPGHI